MCPSKGYIVRKKSCPLIVESIIVQQFLSPFPTSVVVETELSVTAHFFLLCPLLLFLHSVLTIWIWW